MAHGRFDNPVIASLAGVKDFFSKQKLEDHLKDTDRADGKTCIITGANSGLGYAMAVEMAKRGARVIMACRSQIPEAGEKVKMESGSDQVEMLPLDLSKIDSIHQFVETLKKRNLSIDITILNAGVALPKARKLASGQEEMFFVNYLSNFILVNLMLANGLIENRSNGMAKPRILFISSDSHQGSSAIDFEQFGNYEDYGVSKGISYYSYYKLVLNTLAIEFSRRLENKNINVLTICPGPVHSNIIREAPWLLRKTLGAIFSLVFRKPAVAARPVIYMALSKDYEDKNGSYLHMFNPKKMDPKIYIPEEGLKLWDYSERLWKQIDPKAEEIKFNYITEDEKVG
ncbi:MAG: SDR family NAD(P)-dependent oxidoreductase [Bacteroidetes bacterium]|nr:SDR family NAD(P)-dependent oxidoreductase [Bacteroidota bacterium]